MALEPRLADPGHGIEGFYLFSFNQVAETLAWREDILWQLAQSKKIG
jgi:hypothetical protein